MTNQVVTIYIFLALILHDLGLVTEIYSLRTDVFRVGGTKTYGTALACGIIQKRLLRQGKVCMTDNERNVISATVPQNEDYAILVSKTRDRALVIKAITILLKERAFLEKSNCLQLVTDALLVCRAPPHQMLYHWKVAHQLRVQVKKKDIKNLLSYCSRYRGRDSSLEDAIDLICSFDKSKHWDSAIVNMIVQIYSDNMDLSHSKGKSRKRTTLSEIFTDIMQTKERIMDEKSIVMSLKYFSRIGDYATMSKVFSFRANVIKRPVDGHLMGGGGEDKENPIIWNAYLTALIKLSAKQKFNDNNRHFQEACDLLELMLDQKIADFYTANIMLEYYSSKIIENKKNEQNKKKGEELIQKSLEIWNRKQFVDLRRACLNAEYLDDYNTGCKISYGIIVKSLLLSASNTSSKKDDATREQKIGDTQSTDANIPSTEKNKYVEMALTYALEVPVDEVTSSVLYAMGLSEYDSMTATKYMGLLSQKKYKLSRLSGTNSGFDGGAKVDIDFVTRNGIDSASQEKEVWDEINIDSSHQSNKALKISHLESLLGGYYDSARYDLIVQTYLLACENTPDDNYKNGPRKVFESIKFTDLNIHGNTKAFNIFLAALKALIKTDFLNHVKKSPKERTTKIKPYEQLWEFSKSVLREIIKVQEENNLPGSKGGNTDKSFSMDKNVGSAPRPSDIVKNTGKSDVNTDNSLLDVYTIVTAIDIANLLSDNRMASELFYSQEKCSSNPSHRVLQSYLRAFQLPSHLSELDIFINEDIEKAVQYKSLFSPYNDRNEENLRTFDEIINAYLRVGNLPIALEIASKYSNKFSDSALRNLLIHFDRYWRDYDNETIYVQDLLKGQERLERSYSDKMNSFRNSNFQPSIPLAEKDYYSCEAEQYVRSPSAYVTLQDVTSRCMEVEAVILSDILANRAEENPPLYVFWSVLTGVLLSRGDWDAAVDILSNMECLGIDSNTKNAKFKYEVNDGVNKNKYYGGNSKTKTNKRPYTGTEISQTVELAVLYSLAGGLPLLTMSGEKALVAMDLKRLLAEDIDESVNQEDKNNIQANGNESATKKTKLSNSLHSISESLNRIPADLALDSSEKRTVCTLGDIIGFLERCRGDVLKGGEDDKDDIGLTQDGLKGLSSFEDYDDVSDTYDRYSTYAQRRKESSRKIRIPVGIALLQSLFAAAINERKFKQAARIIRLLEGSRLVIDLDPPALAAASSESVTARQSVSTPNLQTITQPTSPPVTSPPAQLLINNNDSSRSISVGAASNTVTNITNDTSAVKLVRETLARRWAAMLIASSLNKLKSNVAGSLKMMAALKFLQGDEK